VIVFFGGTNDIAYANGRPIGSFDPATAPISADLSATEWESFADGYVEAILRLKYYYPDTQIIAVLPTLNKSHYNATTLEKYNSIVRSICIYYGIEYVDLVAEGFTTAMLGDATHPNADGMDFITAAVKKVIS
jgi:lysophospholipase L1-like esterase